MLQPAPASLSEVAIKKGIHQGELVAVIKEVLRQLKNPK
jgi:hypothetical protein